MTYFRTIDAATAGTRYPNAVAIYEGLNSLADHLTEHATGNHDMSYRGDDSFFGRHNWNKALDAVRNGDPLHVGESDRLLGELEGAVSMATPRRIWSPSVAGPALHLGNYLAGAPAMCRTRMTEPHEFAPLTVCVSMTCSSGNSERQLVARGAAVLALLRNLCSIRPVNLFAMSAIKPSSCSHNLISLTKVDTAPLSMAHASFMLCDMGSSRRIGWAAADVAGVMAGVSDGGSGYVQWLDNALLEAEKAERALMAHLFPSDDVLYVAPLALWNGATVADNPVAWVRDMLAQYGIPETE